MPFYIEAETIDGEREIHWARNLGHALELVSDLLALKASVRIIEDIPDTAAERAARAWGSRPQD